MHTQNPSYLCYEILFTAKYKITKEATLMTTDNSAIMLPDETIIEIAEQVSQGIDLRSGMVYIGKPLNILDRHDILDKTKVPYEYWTPDYFLGHTTDQGVQRLAESDKQFVAIEIPDNFDNKQKQTLIRQSKALAECGINVCLFDDDSTFDPFTVCSDLRGRMIVIH